LTTEAEDLRTIVEYLGILPSSPEVQSITGLTESAIADLLSGRRVRSTRRHTHIAVVASVIRRLAEARQAASLTADRGDSAMGWLHTAQLSTSVGIQTPLAVLSDTSLALEALDGLER
jgi:hypothetical protein